MSVYSLWSLISQPHPLFLSPFLFSLISSSLPTLCFVLSSLCLGPSLSDGRGGCGFVEISVCCGHRRLWPRLRCGSRWLLGCGIDESVVGLWKSVSGLWEMVSGLCGFGFWWVCLVVESGLVAVVVLLDFRWWWLLCCGWDFSFSFFSFFAMRLIFGLVVIVIVIVVAVEMVLVVVEGGCGGWLWLGCGVWLCLCLGCFLFYIKHFKEINV